MARKSDPVDIILDIIKIGIIIAIAFVLIKAVISII